MAGLVARKNVIFENFDPPGGKMAGEKLVKFELAGKSWKNNRRARNRNTTGGQETEIKRGARPDYYFSFPCI